MQDKQLKSHDTDITGVLVVTLIVMLGILFVKLTGNLTKKTTSTSMRAQDYKTDAVICAEKVNPISNGVYPSIKRAIAGSGNGKCEDNGSGNVSAWWGTGVMSSDFKKCALGKCVSVPHNLDCCINANDYTKIGTAFCNTYASIYDSNGNLISPKPDAKCKDACDTTDGYNKVLYYNSATDPNSPLNLTIAAWCKTTTSNAGVATKIQGKCCFK